VVFVLIFFHLMLVSAKCGCKRRRKGCWSISTQVGAGIPELTWSGSSSCICIHAGWSLSSAAAPLGTEITCRNNSSLNKPFLLQEHMRGADQNPGHAETVSRINLSNGSSEVCHGCEYHIIKSDEGNRHYRWT